MGPLVFGRSLFIRYYRCFLPILAQVRPFWTVLQEVDTRTRTVRCKIKVAVLVGPYG